MLIDLFAVANCAEFFGYLLVISNFQLFDIGNYMVDTLPVFESESINIHFEETGYEYSDSILSLGTIIIIIFIVPVILLIILPMRYFCCCLRVRNFLKQ